MLSDVAKEVKTIFITSTIISEGNTYIAINLTSNFWIIKQKRLVDRCQY